MDKKRSKYIKRALNHAIIWLFVIVILTDQWLLPAQVWAQDATPSATPTTSPSTPTPTWNPFDESIPTTDAPTASPTPTPQPSPTPTPSPVVSFAPTPAVSFTPTPTLEPAFDPTQQVNSGRVRLPLHARQLGKNLYRAAEGVVISVDNVIDQTDDVHVTVADANGNDVSVVIDSSIANETDTITVHQRSSLRPGKYTVKVWKDNVVVSQQDFLWGVLAINTNKSIYAPGETANLAIAVLNEFGKMVCNASVSLDIVNPDGEITTLSTQKGTITVNDACKIHNFTLVPDYEAHYQVGGDGRYGMNLTATTANGTYSITDAFEVDAGALFDVERISATRIYPPKTYPMTLRVTPNVDFQGTVEETIPQNFTVSQLNGVVPYREADIVSDEMTNASASAQTVSLGMPFSGDYPETQGFGVQVTDPDLKQKYLRFGVIGHDGVDFGLPLGTDVLSVDDGIVVSEAPEPYGKTLIVEHSWGRSYYGHLSKYVVDVGQKVQKGDVIALSGNTGESTGPHLHFGMRLNSYDIKNGYYGKINPMPYLTANSAVISDTAVKKIYWDLSMKKGETQLLGYSFKAPSTSPQFYLLGPLRFRGNVSESELSPDMTTAPAASDSALNAFILGETTATASGTPEATPSASPTVIPTLIPTLSPTPTNAPAPTLSISDWFASDAASLSVASGSAQPASSSATLEDTIRALKRQNLERIQATGVVFAESRQWQLAIDSPGNTLSSVTHVTGTTSTSGTTTNVTISGGTALNKMFHFCSFRGNYTDATHNQTYKGTYLTSTTNLAIVAGTTPTFSENYDCYILNYTTDSDLVVNRYAADSTLNPGPRNVTITAVSSLSQAFVIPEGEVAPSSDTTIGMEEEFEYRLTTTTNVAIYYTQYDNAEANSIRFEVVDWNNSDIRVQHMDGNTMSTSETTDTVTLTNTVNMNDTFIIVTSREEGAAYSQAQGVEDRRADLQDANTVRFRRGYLGSPAVAIGWGAEVIEDRSDYGLWNVQRGTISLGTAASSGTFSLTSPVHDVNYTIPLGGDFPNFDWTGSSTDTTTDRLRDTTFTLTITNNSTLTATRGATDSLATDVDVQVVEFINKSLGLDLSDLMRHGNWFSAAGVEQYFTF